MRCKNHYTDLSSTIGVCACCLRERLVLVIAAQERVKTQPPAQNLAGKRLNSEKNPAHSTNQSNSAFPRSVSPYTHNRKRNQFDEASVFSDSNARNDRRPHVLPSAPHHRHSLSDQLFYRTPEVGTTSGVDSNHKRSFIRFFSFQYIFRSRNRKSVDSVSDLNATDSDATSSFSWFSSIVHGKRRRRKQPVCVDESTVATAGVAGAGRRHACRDRGMSPVRNSDVSGVDENESNNATSEYESTESWKNTPRRTPARRGGGGGGGGGGGHVRSISGLTFCLSPLVRASPKRQWKQNGLQNDVVSSCEIRGPVKPHLSNTKSFHANRSRKLADFGRPNQKR